MAEGRPYRRAQNEVSTSTNERDRTLFTTAEGIERPWEVSQALLDAPPDVLQYRVGSWGPPAIQDLIEPRSWRLPFERGWRQRP